MALKAGSLDDNQFEYATSMAKAMEIAFLEEWPKVMRGSDTPVMDKQMSLMFVAIAQGVVKHLASNAGAFKVSVGISGAGQVSEIDTDPPTA